MPCTLYVFQHDLRVHDNSALLAAAQKEQALICLFCVDPEWFKPKQYSVSRINAHRWHFLNQSLIALDTSLRSRGQRLHIIYGNPIDIINRVIQQHGVNHIIRSRHSGYYEYWQWVSIEKRHPRIAFDTHDTFTLFTREKLSILPKEFPSTFSKFRKQVEALAVDKIEKTPENLPPTLAVEQLSDHPPHYPQSNPPLFTGGEISALEHLQNYFSSDAASNYKKTRNALDDWTSSCKFSPWLANGSLSAREIVNQLRYYEKKYGSNESTEWIYFELLWREYFQWYAHYFGKKLFSFKGINNKRPLTTFYPQRFKQWCEGKTPWPIINACMNQLNETGYLSNRGRQLAASCLIHELALDWRCGASYFEYQLIDYDVASNWGNWQYIAGVGADPRGGRRFNLKKQAQLYDPEGAFIKHWDNKSHSIPIDSYDAADWPISPSP